MAGLLDIGKLQRTIKIRDTEQAVEGLTAHGIFELLDQFPELQRVFSDAGVRARPQQLMAQAPGAVTTIIAYVCGYRRNAAVSLEQDTNWFAALKAAAGLSLGEQTDIIKAAWELTFPSGLQSFLGALEAVGAIGSGWDQATASPGQSSNSSQPVTHQNTLGGTPPDNSPPT